MGKLVVIGDIHGRAVWRKIVDDNPDADKFIFLGDYFDSHEKKYYTKVFQIYRPDFLLKYFFL